jgi:hypothetical protein
MLHKRPPLKVNRPVGVPDINHPGVNRDLLRQVRHFLALEGVAFIVERYCEFPFPEQQLVKRQQAVAEASSLSDPLSGLISEYSLLPPSTENYGDDEKKVCEQHEDASLLLIAPALVPEQPEQLRWPKQLKWIATAPTLPLLGPCRFMHMNGLWGSSNHTPEFFMGCRFWENEQTALPPLVLASLTFYLREAANGRCQCGMVECVASGALQRTPDLVKAEK